MDDLKFLLDADMKRLNELKNELKQLEEKINKQQEKRQQDQLRENLEDIRREKDRLFISVNHTINLIHIEKIQQNKKRRLYVFNCFMFEPLGLYFPDHEEIVYIIDEIDQEDTERSKGNHQEEQQKRIKILSKYYGEYIDESAPTYQEQNEINRFERENPQHRRQLKQCPHLEFKQGRQKNIILILKKTEDLRRVIQNDKGDAFCCNVHFNILLLNLLHKNILNVYIPCSLFKYFLDEIELKPIKEKVRLIKADCMGSRQDCEVCSPHNVMSIYEEYRTLTSKKE